MDGISESAKETLAKSDAERAKARKGASLQRFRSSFIHTHAAEIEMIRRGAIVTDVDKDGKPTAFKMPDGKPVPTARQARWAIRWSRFTRFLRTCLNKILRLRK